MERFPTRRKVLQCSLSVTGGLWLSVRFPYENLADAAALTGTPEEDSSAQAGPVLQTDDAVLQQRYDAAVQGLRKNVQRLYRFSSPVLIEGGRYPGIWLECGPHEGLVYAAFDAETARNNHRIFFELQREDGYLPYSVKADRSGASQIQSVIPIAATALELAERTHDEQLLEQAYRACGAWDAWLRRYRDTRGTGLCEAFCGYDTGMDGNARFSGLPWKCPNDDARQCPEGGILPYLAPDLSANVYGGRRALARMATLLGKRAEACEWDDRAEQIKLAMMRWCFDLTDLSFYDRDAKNHLVRMHTVALIRVLGEHVVDPHLFEEIYRRHIRNPKEFWTPYPFPSVAASDATFTRQATENCWCGPSQALTALRAPRWMEHYGKPADLAHLMQQWVRALAAASDFQQQIDPWTGAFSTGTQYSPSMLALVDFTARLYGVREEAERLEWNCRLPEKASHCRFTMRTQSGTVELLTRRTKEHGAVSELRLSGKLMLTVSGDTARVVTDTSGKPVQLVGTAEGKSKGVLTGPDQRRKVFEIEANRVVELGQKAREL